MSRRGQRLAGGGAVWSRSDQLADNSPCVTEVTGQREGGDMGCQG